jgi:hypothetical protein
LLDDYLDGVRAGHRIVMSVCSETRAFARVHGPELLRPIGEIEFANGVGAMCASGVYGNIHVCAAIVGYADMRDADDVARLLDRCIQTAPERFRGVRQITMEHPSEEPFRFITAATAGWGRSTQASARPSGIWRRAACSSPRRCSTTSFRTSPTSPTPFPRRPPRSIIWVLL